MKNECMEKRKNFTIIKEDDLIMKDLNENNIEPSESIIQSNWEQLQKDKENFTQSEFLKNLNLNYNMGNVGTIGNTYNNTTSDYYQGCDTNQIMNQVVLYIQNIIGIVGKEYEIKWLRLWII